MWWLSIATAGATPPLVAEMHESLALLTETRDHVVQGRLDDAKLTAGMLAEVETPRGLPGPWDRSLRHLRRESRRTARSDHLVDAALGVGRLAQLCGDCHADAQGGPGLDALLDAPSERWVEGQNMALHKWASDWMWLGLVASDDAAWRRGAEGLDDRPLLPRFEGAPPRSHRTQLEQLVYGIANMSLSADPSERGTLMGELLATCAECHVTRPTPTP